MNETLEIYEEHKEMLDKQYNLIMEKINKLNKEDDNISDNIALKDFILRLKDYALYLQSYRLFIGYTIDRLKEKNEY